MGKDEKNNAPQNTGWGVDLFMEDQWNIIEEYIPQHAPEASRDGPQHDADPRTQLLVDTCFYADHGEQA